MKELSTGTIDLISNQVAQLEQLRQQNTDLLAAVEALLAQNAQFFAALKRVASNARNRFEPKHDCCVKSFKGDVFISDETLALVNSVIENADAS